MRNFILKKQMINAVEKQIKSNNPPCTKATFFKLQEQGCSKQEAKEMIASVMLEQMYDVLRYGMIFDEKKYESELIELLNDDFIFDDVAMVLADEKDEMLQARNKIYDALYEHKSADAICMFMDLWDKIKKFIINEFYDIDTYGNTLKPEIMDVDDKTEFKYEFYNLFQDMEMQFSNAKMYKERIRFCRDAISLFAWNEDSADDYKTAIGEAYNSLEKYEDCDELFESWLKEESDNPNCICSYLFCLMERGDTKKAQKIAEKYITNDIQCTIDNEFMFFRVQLLYEKIGDKEKSLKYRIKIEKFQEELYKESL